MFTWMWIFEIVLFCDAVGRWPAAAAQPPNMTTTCEEFERGARFNPYELIESVWKIFYFWGDNSEIYPIIFSLPAKNRLLKFKQIVESIDPGLNVEWDKATLFMNPRPGTDVVFLYSGSPGAFRAFIVREQRHNKVRPFPQPLMKLADVRMKIEGKFLGMMCCEDNSAYALSRVENLPVTERHCEEVAARLGLRGSGGRSYIYLKKKINDEL